jgi:hypothetical protein
LDPFTKRERLCLFGVFGLFTAILITYSQTWAYTGDEGFHLLAAQSILRGMRPWIDFCFPQAPLIAYWNGAWMRLLGQSWRVSHVISAILTACAVILVTHYVGRRFPLRGTWRFGAAIAAGLLAGLNAVVFEFGPLGQAYGLCLLLLVAAFRMSIRDGAGSALAAGFLASGATACSLLTAPAAPVFLVWIALQRRWNRVAAFLAGATVPWLPTVWLIFQGPHQAWFNLVEYQARFRKLYWPETTQHDLEIITSWIDSGQALLLGALAIGGLLWVMRQSDWPRPLKSQLYLCGWVALAIYGALGFAHPTFARYYLLGVPFLAILAAVGLYAAGTRLTGSGPTWPLIAALFLTTAGLAKSVYERRENYTWSDYEAIARRIESATPSHGTVFAGELLYFLMHRQPTPGLEFYYDRKVSLPPAELALLHIMPQAELERRLSSGFFDTVYICEDDETYDRLGLPKLYQKREDIEDCALFSGRK